MATTESLVFVNKSIIGPSSVVVGATTFPQTTLQATGTTTLVGNVFVQGGALYPPGPMTAASTTLSGFAYGNGTYVASSLEIANYSKIWYAFDNSISTLAESAGVYAASSPYAYSNTTPYAYSNTVDAGTTTTYNGVWLQLQIPSAIVLEYYTIVPTQAQETVRSPATWRVFGSNDGTNWYTIDAQAGVTSWLAPQVSKTFYLSPLPSSYSYYRLSVQNVNGSSGGILDVTDWKLYGKPPVPAMTILGGDVTIASGGGLNVGSGTLGSNVVIFSNVSGGSNVLVMDTNGRVGLGTTAPSFPFQVYGTSTNFTSEIKTSGAGAVFQLTDSSGSSFIKFNNSLQFWISGVNTFASTANEVLTFSYKNLGTPSQPWGILYANTINLSNATATITGNLYVSNALTTTNIFVTTANTSTLNVISVSNLATLAVTNNVYAPNAVTTTNLFTAGITSNATNTIFNFDTLTIPFISSTTLNVASSANVLTQTVQGSAGLLSLGVIGNASVSNALTTTNAFLTGTLNVQGMSNLTAANIANIYTTNIVGFVGSQWTGTVGSPIYYINPVGIGTSTVTSNLTVSGNIYASNSIQTGNLILGGVTSGGFLQAQGTGNVTSVSTIPIASGGTNQTTYGTTGGIVYYDGTRFQAASGIVASTATTLNVATANISTLQTGSFIPAASGLFMNLNATYTLNSTGNWTGNIAGTITSNLYTLFAPLPGITGWNAYGTSTLVNAPTVNGGIKFNQPGPYMITAVISADNDIKTIALSSNTADVHSNITNVWSYCYRFGVGTNPSIPVTIPVNVTNTSTYYYIDIETTNQTDNIHQTAYTNTASQAYTGSYVIIRPI